MIGKIGLIITVLVSFSIADGYKTITRATYNKMKQEPKVALVIGNKDYEVDSLTYPLIDARKIKNFLEEKDFKVIYDKNVRTKGKLRKLINQFINSISTNGTGVFYFSGHGMSAYHQNYLIPTKNSSINDDEDIEDIGLSVNYLLRKLEKKGNRLNIVMLDACRNTLGKGSSSALGGDSAEGVFIAYATAEGKRAKDNGLFASSFVENAKIQGLTVEEVFKRVRKRIKRTTGQTPFTNSGIVGDFYFTLPSVKHKINTLPLTKYKTSRSSTFQKYLNELYDGNLKQFNNYSLEVQKEVEKMFISGELDNNRFWKMIEPIIINDDNNEIIFSRVTNGVIFKLEKELFYKNTYLIRMMLTTASMTDKEIKDWMKFQIPIMTPSQKYKLYKILHKERRKLFILDLEYGMKSNMVNYGKYKE